MEEDGGLPLTYATGPALTPPPLPSSAPKGGRQTRKQDSGNISTEAPWGGDGVSAPVPREVPRNCESRPCCGTPEALLSCRF